MPNCRPNLHSTYGDYIRKINAMQIKKKKISK